MLPPFFFNSMDGTTNDQREECWEGRTRADKAHGSFLAGYRVMGGPFGPARTTRTGC